MFTNSGWIIKRAALSPNQIALIDVHTEKAWTYTMLKDCTLQWATLFTQKGYQKGERITVLAPNCLEMFAILFACELKGLVYVPINWRLSDIEIAALLKDCTPSVLIYDESFASVIEKMLFQCAIPLNSAKNIEIEVPTHSTLNQNGREPWLMIYTGGTTGKPKGVVISKDAVNANAINTIISWGLSETDTTINYMPLFHTGGINALCMPLLMAGGTVVIGNKFNAEEALRATNRYGATISLFVPTMYQAMIQTTYFKQSRFDSMKVFLSGGAPCPETIYFKFQEKGIHFKEGYGLTEAGPNNFFIRTENAFKKIGSVGKPMMFIDVNVTNENGEDCMAHEVGELQLKGPHLFSDYWNNPTATTNVFHNGWLRTGDLAKFDEDGDYYIVGRKKDMIISGGENVYPQEVEQCLTNFESVDEAAVIGKKDDKWGESVIAFITIIDDVSYDREKLLAHCKKNLGSFKVPKEIIELPELPKTHVGKIDKNALLHYIENDSNEKSVHP